VGWAERGRGVVGVRMKKKETVKKERKTKTV